MRLENILHQIISLTKEIKLKMPVDNLGMETQFFAGRDPIFRGMGLTFWYTKKALSNCDNIASMAISYDTNLRFGNKITFSETIRKAIQENALDDTYFKDGLVFFRDCPCLFEARSVADVRMFSERLWDLIHKYLSDSLTNWLIIYPLSKIKSESFSLGFDGIALLNPSDNSFWEKVSSNYEDAKYWEPINGRRKHGSYFSFKTVEPFSWLVCEIKGNSGTALRNAAKIMRKFIAVVFSFLSINHKNILQRCDAQANSYSTQFPSNPTQVGSGQITSSIGTLLPPLLNDFEITEEIRCGVKEWYNNEIKSTQEKINRVTIGSQFINYGMVANNVEQFIHFFIALDAFYGMRDKVEDSIKEGIKNLFHGDKKWINRAEKLFELRSELIHGGASEIEEWKGLEHYRRYFRSEPLKDVEIAAFMALNNYYSI